MASFMRAWLLSPTLVAVMRVVRFDIDPQSNPWGLALDGFSTEQQPTRLTDQDSGANS